MTEQEVFDKVYTHLLKQKKQCMNEEYTCMYRYTDEKGKKLMCAAGCLIPDKTYRKAFEEKSWDQVVEMNPMMAKELGLEKHISLINRLQLIHDCEDVENWKGELTELAKVYELTVPTL